MPRTTEEILAHADQLARRFEEHEPDGGRDATTLRELARAFEVRARAEADLASAVATARADGHTWAAVGAMLGTSGEAARQRYGTPRPDTDQTAGSAGVHHQGPTHAERRAAMLQKADKLRAEDKSGTGSNQRSRKPSDLEESGRKRA